MARLETPSLPANPEAERAIIGGVLMENLAYEDAAEAGIHPDDFMLEGHRRIWRRIEEMRSRDCPIDIVTLTEELGKRGEIESVGGVAYVSGLTDGIPHRPNIRSYVEIVRDKSRLRQLVHALTRSLCIAQEETSSAGYLISEAAEDLLKLQESGVRNEITTLGSCGPMFLEELESMRHHQGEVLGLTTGLKRLDRVTTGFRRAEFIVLGAFTGRGKTAFACNVALRNARHDVPVGFFSLEMEKHELLGRMVSDITEIDYDKIRNPRELSDTDMRVVRVAVEGINRMPILVEDTPGIELGELIARARLLIRRNHVRLIVVDHLHLVTVRGARDRRSEVTEVVRSLSRLAKSTKIPVLSLAQLTRAKDKDINERPTMFHLKESGEIEQNANLILLLHNPVNTQTEEPTGEDEVIVAKQRAGIKGTVWATFNAPFQRWEDRWR